jgi:hypothetical protein
MNIISTDQKLMSPIQSQFPPGLLKPSQWNIPKQIGRATAIKHLHVSKLPKNETYQTGAHQEFFTVGGGLTLRLYIIYV